ncbi:hypothetical protein C7974DRAFT_430193 [Boeremia exigua]|uniref:uncharacterized protein n=1 Tax=Boeremia exigua TaxID=749465 RepID=UPI001E8EB20C|nr:uncharacterized protein C7974DRAFT_430193 [Boeremia exigua]KAH6644330.1 hypothetical protein C7974DRAFT_430193 [Boeremia exigua]
MQFLAAVAVFATAFAAVVRAQNASSSFVPAASTFYLPDTETQFSVNIASDSRDLYFYFASPAYSWVGVGFGAQMENSLMLVMYPDGNGDNVTISPRSGRKGGEPTFTSNVEIEVLDGTRVEDGMMILHARCSDCRVWPNGFLDATSRAQNMIYAFGSPYALQSSSPSADLKRHVRYGHFTMDMTAATGTGGVPLKSNLSNGVQQQGSMTKDTDRKTLAHAVLGCLVLFIVWPLALLLATFLKNIRLRLTLSIIVLACLTTVYALGISSSAQYNRSQSFTTPHQLLALITLAPLLLLAVLLAPALSALHPAHGPLAALTLALLLVTGGLGLHLAAQTRALVLSYTGLALLVLVVLACGSVIARRRARDRGAAERAEMALLRKGSEASFKSSLKGSAGSAGSATSLRGFLDESRREPGVGSGSGRARAGVYGGGAMPGPQYLLNMHPGVPVHFGGRSA